MRLKVTFLEQSDAWTTAAVADAAVRVVGRDVSDILIPAGASQAICAAVEAVALERGRAA